MAQVEKIYSLKTIGFEQIMSELDALAKKFVEVKKAKQGYEAQLNENKRRQKEQSDAIKAEKQSIEELKLAELELKKGLKETAIAELELKKAIKEKSNEAKAAALAEKEQQAAQKAAIAGNNAEANSIAAIRKERSELNATVIRVAPGKDVTFRGNTLGYDEAITKLKQLSAVEQDFRRQFAKDSTLVGEYTSGIIQAFKKLGIDDLVTGQVTKANGRLQELNKEFEVLKQELKSVRETGQGSLENLEKQLIDNRNAAGLLEKEVGRLQTELRGTGDIGNQITTGLANGFKAMKGQLAQFVLSYVGFQAAFQGITAGIGTAKELSDATTNLEIELGKTAGGADKLVASLQKLNTRTQLTELENMANIAAKAGVSEENLLGVTEALDKIKIAFGSDFGNVEEGTESLVKLINIFEGADSVTGENLLRTGNAVRTLANETVASVPFLNDFARRMAGLKGISDISLPAVLGLASGFEQFGQSSEVAGTALTKVIPKLATDTAKYAQIAGMTRQAFADLLKDNPAEALIRVSENLVKSKAGIEEVSKAFADSQLGSGRIAAILGTVGAKADDFRKAIASAGAAYEDTGNIEDAFAKKNDNLASVLDKISKAFADAANSEAFKNTLEGISTVVLTLIRLITAIPFSIILGGLGLITAAWAFYKGNLISATLAQSANNQATLLGSVRLGLMRSGLMGTAAAEKASAIISANVAAQKIAALEAQVIAERQLLAAIETRVVAEGEETLLLQADIAARRAKVVALEAEIVATRGATVATEGLNIATKASPLGVILTLVAIALPALSAFGRSNEDAASKVSKLNSSLRIQGDIEAQMREQTTKTKNSVNELISIIKTEVDNQSLRQKAYQQLIRIAPEFQGTLDAEYRATDKLNKVYDAYIIQLDKVARAQAIRTVKQKIENDKAEAQNREFLAKLAADEEAAANKAIEAQNKATALKGLSGNNLGAAGAAFASIEKVQTEKQKQYLEAKEAAKKANKAALDFTAFMKGANEDDKKALVEGLGGDKPTQTTGTNDLSTVGLAELQEMLKAVNNQIAGIDKIRNKSLEQINQLKALRKQRNEIRAQIKELGGTLSLPRVTASTLTAGDKDALAIEDTKRDLLLARENTARAQNLEDEETYLRNVLKINQDSIDAKLKLITGESIAEQKLRAELGLQRIKEEQDTNKKIFDLRIVSLRNQLDADIAAIKEADNIIQTDPTKTFTERAQAKIDADNAQLELYKKYNLAVDDLEKQLNQNTLKNSRDIVSQVNALQKDKLQGQRELTEGALKDVKATGERLVSEFKATVAQMRLNIINSTKSTDQKNLALEELDRQENIGILAREVASEKSQLPIYKKLLDEKKITEKEYFDFLEKMKSDQAKLIDSTTKDLQVNVIKVTDLRSFFTRGLRSLFSFDTVNQGDDKATVAKKVALQEMFAQTVAQTYDLARTAMNDYYNAEAQQIERSRSTQEKRLQLELDQAKARATSDAERESIDKQFAARKEANDRAAFEKNKKVQKQQALINLAMQLSNLAVVASFPGPANLLTAGIAGQIMYAVQSVLALVNYAMNVNRINSAQFDLGGNVPRKGGIIKGRSHAQGGVKFNYEAQGEEMSIIRTQNAPKNKIFEVKGTIEQIASQINVIGGGVAFAPGAKLKRFEMGGNLGNTLNAPVFVPSQGNSIINNRNGLTEEQLTKIMAKVDEGISATNNRIDRLQVHVNAREVVTKNDKYTKAANVGTL